MGDSKIGTVGALSLSVVSSVSIVICNKALISTLGFTFGENSRDLYWFSLSFGLLVVWFWLWIGRHCCFSWINFDMPVLEIFVHLWMVHYYNFWRKRGITQLIHIFRQTSENSLGIVVFVDRIRLFYGEQRNATWINPWSYSIRHFIHSYPCNHDDYPFR